MTLNELFYKITTSTIDVESLIANSENNKETFNHLIWHMPKGIKYEIIPELKGYIDEFVERISEILDVDSIDDVNTNSKIEIDTE